MLNNWLHEISRYITPRSQSSSPTRYRSPAPIMDPALFNKTIKPLEEGTTPSRLQELERMRDDFTCQSQSSSQSTTQRVNPQKTGGQDPTITILSNIKNQWSQLEDPLDEKIIQNLRMLSCLSGDKSHKLTHSYTNLISITKGRSGQIIEDLKLGVMEGFNTLTLMIKIATSSFSTFASINYGVILSDISVMHTE